MRSNLQFPLLTGPAQAGPLHISPISIYDLRFLIAARIRLNPDCPVPHAFQGLRAGKLFSDSIFRFHQWGRTECVR
jgi:hypothetical protein